MRTYSELITLPTFEERFNYLRLDSRVGDVTFGCERYLNQRFYRSTEWKQLRDKIIVRDMGCDMALPGFEIHSPIYIHHMNPINTKDIYEMTDYLMNPEYLVCVKYTTHNAIHYGDETIIRTNVVTERRPNDTCPWRN